MNNFPSKETTSRGEDGAPGRNKSRQTRIGTQHLECTHSSPDLHYGTNLIEKFYPLMLLYVLVDVVF
jgi:hypothetical protein